MADFIYINGAGVRVSSIYRRTLIQPDTPPREQIELVVILRGSIATRSFADLLRSSPLHVAFPDGPSFEMTVTDDNRAVAGTGESAAHRHDITLTETLAAAERRAAASPGQGAPSSDIAEDEREPEPADDETDPADLASVTFNAPATTWATALRQMTGATDQSEALPPPALDTAHLAGVEAVLVGLRLEALIAALDAAGIVRRSAIDDAFLALIEERFVAEAIPIIGEDAARRVVADLLR
jgi:hypothetical protein